LEKTSGFSSNLRLGAVARAGHSVALMELKACGIKFSYGTDMLVLWDLHAALHFLFAEQKSVFWTAFLERVVAESVVLRWCLEFENVMRVYIFFPRCF
jgi:hypothetical protein